MEAIKIYTSADLEKVKQVLFTHGFRQPSDMVLHNRELMDYPLKENSSPDYVCPIEGVFVDALRVKPEAIRYETEYAGRRQVFPATHFDIDELLEYHRQTHEVPGAIIAASLESVARFCSGLDLPNNLWADKNPLIAATNSLDHPLVFYREKAHSGLTVKLI